MKIFLSVIAIIIVMFNVTAQAPGCIDPALINLNALCPSNYAPVCGCDGITYSNSCFAENVGGVTSYTTGQCAPCIDPNNVDPGCICAGYINPVCGCDGIEYSNACEAQFCGGNTTWTVGPCGYYAPCPNFYSIDLTFDCFANNSDSDPVCGCDDVTYANECIALNYFGIETFTPGPCIQSDCISIEQTNSFYNCSTIVKPVCGCDGATYINECEAALEGGVTSWTEGACCVDSSLIDNSEICSLAYNPICGCDGQTYYNPCVAQNYFGISSWDAGVCDESICYEENQVISTINCNSAATQVICGCDSITYQNTCEAYYLGGIQSWTSGSCATNGINELAKYFSLEIQPNPAKNQFSINLIALANKNITVNLLDLTGKLIQPIFKGSSTNLNNTLINTSDLNNGIYLISIESDGMYLVEKVNILR